MTRPWSRFVEGDGWYHAYTAWRKWAADSDPEAAKLVESLTQNQRLFMFELCERVLEEQCDVN